MRSLVLVGVLLAACSSDDGASDDTTDAPACVGALYEQCTINEDCESGICRTYNALGFSACTTTCTTGDDSTCPAHPDGAEVTCNTMGSQCRPTAPVACTP